MPDDELSMLCASAVSELAGKMAHGLFGADPETDHLARLRVLAHLQWAVAQQCDQTALRAASSGAGYPQLGQAVGITRQGARRRWPGLIAARTDRSGQTARPSSSTDRSR
ncbi:hypothetical protein HUT16_04110 [Kitasatospora sp. NA04385]|uniref:hypothetical protein n=1 Tax=Kitasatospora sp. NA04385 TaxID=2742135 RepID=UPI001590CC1F|nr:hypothetical protein [Kitasatospora sp. NA04385]QKW18356.1 hypothetical protein HUT16_04110 [Kitasatospora sp. NA04385]